jgi:hypothetical protein
MWSEFKWSLNSGTAHTMLDGAKKASNVGMIVVEQTWHHWNVKESLSLDV